MLCTYYVGETITKVMKTALTPGGTEVILYTTLSGTIGALLPFSSHEDVNFFTTLEMHLRQEKLSIIGREHLSFRSYYAPCKGVIDGDLCEQFTSLPRETRDKIALALDRTALEVQRKLEIQLPKKRTC